MKESNPNSTNRNQAIDALRGIAVIAMVLAHTNAYFLSNPTAILLWDLSLFSVHSFILCSAYLFFASAQKRTATYDFGYFKKRILRLLLPYYIFLIAFFSFQWIYQRDQLTVSYIVKNITLTGGIDFNWLVLLFIYFTILMPVIEILYRKSKPLFYVYVALSLLASIILLFMKIPIHFKFVMWLPWSLVIIATLYAQKAEPKKNRIMQLSCIWLIIFLATLAYQYFAGHSIRQFENKYPPNLFHISYGIAASLGIYYFCKSKLFSLLRVQPFLDFLSKNSYSFYFIHILVLNLFTKVFEHKKLGWQLFFAVILLISCVVQKVLNYAYARFSLAPSQS